MPYETFWYVEDRVIGTHFYGDITEEDMTSSGQRIEEYIKQGKPPLFLLNDVRDVSKFPLGFKSMTQDMSSYRIHKSRIAWTVILSSNSLINFFGSLASKVVGVPVSTFKTQTEVDSFLAHMAPELAQALATREASRLLNDKGN